MLLKFPQIFSQSFKEIFLVMPFDILMGVIKRRKLKINIFLLFVDVPSFCFHCFVIVRICCFVVCCLLSLLFYSFVVFILLLLLYSVLFFYYSSLLCCIAVGYRFVVFIVTSSDLALVPGLICSPARKPHPS